MINELINNDFVLTEDIVRGTYCNNSRKSGFTLAEVLITLGIIGVVASLVLPTLIEKFKDKVYITQTKKTYSTVQTVFNQWMYDKGCLDYACLFEQSKTQAELSSEFLSYFKSVKTCKLYVSGCLADNIKLPKATNNGHGKLDVMHGKNWYSAILADGSAVGIIPYVNGDENCERIFVDRLRDENGNYISDGKGGYKTKETYSKQCGVFLIDSNGLEGPNQLGADVYTFIINNKSIFNWHTKIDTVLVDEKLDYINYNLDNIKGN